MSTGDPSPTGRCTRITGLSPPPPPNNHPSSKAATSTRRQCVSPWPVLPRPKHSPPPPTRQMPHPPPAAPCSYNMVPRGACHRAWTPKVLRPTEGPNTSGEETAIVLNAAYRKKIGRAQPYPQHLPHAYLFLPLSDTACSSLDPRLLTCRAQPFWRPAITVAGGCPMLPGDNSPVRPHPLVPALALDGDPRPANVTGVLSRGAAVRAPPRAPPCSPNPTNGYVGCGAGIPVGPAGRHRPPPLRRPSGPAPHAAPTA